MSKRYRTAAAPWLSFPAAAYAHSIDERYDLPAPLAYFIGGATAAVAGSFVIAVLFVRARPDDAQQSRQVRITGLPLLRGAMRAVALALFVTTIAAGLFGTGDAMMNLAPTLVWGVWWLGLTVVVACIGNVWPAIDPWRTLFDALDAAARLLGRARGAALGW